MPTHTATLCACGDPPKTHACILCAYTRTHTLTRYAYIRARMHGLCSTHTLTRTHTHTHTHTHTQHYGNLAGYLRRQWTLSDHLHCPRTLGSVPLYARACACVRLRARLCLPACLRTRMCVCECVHAMPCLRIACTLKQSRNVMVRASARGAPMAKSKQRQKLRVPVERFRCIMLCVQVCSRTRACDLCVFLSLSLSRACSRTRWLSLSSSLSLCARALFLSLALFRSLSLRACEITSSTQRRFPGPDIPQD